MGRLVVVLLMGTSKREGGGRVPGRLGIGQGVGSTWRLLYTSEFRKETRRPKKIPLRFLRTGKASLGRCLIPPAGPSDAVAATIAPTTRWPGHAMLTLCDHGPRLCDGL